MTLSNAKKQDLYSLDQYQGINKWCFGLMLSKAVKVNLGKQGAGFKHPGLLNHTLLRYENHLKDSWFEEGFRKTISKKVKQNKQDVYVLKDEWQNKLNHRVNELRNYFSHYFHTAKCLDFSSKDDLEIKEILEKAYERAQLESRRKETSEAVGVTFPPLFDKDHKINALGVVFFVSLYVERGVFNRLFGYVCGLKKSAGDYKILRNVLATYCLKDGYSARTQDQDETFIMDTLGYLSQIPKEHYQHNKADRKKEDKNPERKTEKFAVLAMRFIEDYGQEDLGQYSLCFARKRIERREDTSGVRPHRKKSKITMVYDITSDLPYYVNHNNVLIRINDGKEEPRTYRMGLDELKYLFLMSLQGRLRKGVDKLYHYQTQVLSALETKQYTDEVKLRLPEFVNEYLKLQPKKDKLGKRIEYVCEKWDRKRERSNERNEPMSLHQKARDVLQYVNECMQAAGKKKHIAKKRPMEKYKPKALDVDAYRELLVCLVNKDFGVFYKELAELAKSGRIEKTDARVIENYTDIDRLHERVCDLIRDKIERLKRCESECRAYLGLCDNKGLSYKEKLDSFKKRMSIRKWFLRDCFFKGKKFSDEVEALLKKTGQEFDVPLGKSYYSVDGDKHSKENIRLREVLALDRLCLMAASRCYENFYVNKNHANAIEWKNEGKRVSILLEIANEDNRPLQVRFDSRNYLKFYVLDDLRMLRHICFYILGSKSGEVDYHDLFGKGVKRYHTLQKECMEAILEFEEKLGEGREDSLEWKEGKYIKIDELMKDRPEELGLVKKIRHSVFHHDMNFDTQDFVKFEDILSTQGVAKKWKITLKNEIFMIAK